jgi:hypothetical protein
MPDMPNQPGGKPHQEEIVKMRDGVNHRRMQDRSQADAQHTIQSTTKQVAVVRQVDLPVNDRDVHPLIYYHPGKTKEIDQPEGRPSQEEDPRPCPGADTCRPRCAKQYCQIDQPGGRPSQEEDPYPGADACKPRCPRQWCACPRQQSVPQPSPHPRHSATMTHPADHTTQQTTPPSVNQEADACQHAKKQCVWQAPVKTRDPLVPAQQAQKVTLSASH